MVREAHEQHARPPRRRTRHAGASLGAGAALLAEDALVRGVLGRGSFLGADAPWGDAAVRLAGLALMLGGVVLLHLARLRLVEPAGGRVLAGSFLFGAGGVALVEALLLHHALGRHHAGPASAPLAGDAAYLALALALMLAGARIVVVADRLRETGDPRRQLRGAGRMG